MHLGDVLAWYTERQWCSRHANHDYGNLAVVLFLRLEWAEQYSGLMLCLDFMKYPLLTFQ